MKDLSTSLERLTDAEAALTEYLTNHNHKFRFDKKRLFIDSDCKDIFVDADFIKLVQNTGIQHIVFTKCIDVQFNSELFLENLNILATHNVVLHDCNIKNCILKAHTIRIIEREYRKPCQIQNSVLVGEWVVCKNEQPIVCNDLQIYSKVVIMGEFDGDLDCYCGRIEYTPRRGFLMYPTIIQQILSIDPSSPNQSYYPTGDISSKKVLDVLQKHGLSIEKLPTKLMIFYRENRGGRSMKAVLTIDKKICHLQILPE